MYIRFLYDGIVNLISAKYCIFRVSVFLAFIAVIVFFLFDVLKSAFIYNVQINSVILLCFFCGVFFIYNRIFLYNREYSKLISFEKLRKEDLDKTKLISPISLYVSRNSNLISQAKLNTIMSSIEKRVEDCGSFPKYISGILIFLGLLGTFWGLSETIGNVANIIDNLGIDQSDSAESFLKLKNSLKIPLSGMGIAFGCSLFGLSSSLVLGFLNINQKRVADKFLDKVEEWITKRTLSFDAVDNHQEYHGSVFSMGLMEKTIEMIYAFQSQLKEFEGNRVSLLGIQKDFSMKLSQLTEAVLKHQDLIKTIGSAQIDIQNVTVSLSKKINDSVWIEMLRKLEGIESSIDAMVHGLFSNREYIVDNLGKEIKMVSKTLSSLVRDE